ncbi:MAG: hypothetical protein NXY57DRAFT_1111682 [Lentinula lateritia]|nr:MAG: hypothetical protein NXY57DRAFT_1111682 [Lentinula lateritia]
MAKGKGKRAQRPGQGEQPTIRAISKTPFPTQCETLDEDEITRCGLPVEDGNIRCKVHQTQYRKMYIKYKEAGKFVDETKSGREMPTKERIAGYTNVTSTLEKARWMRKYLEAIRIERAGRGLHMRRFFAKGECDDGHKIRLKLLEKQMLEAFDLDVVNNPALEWVRSFQTTTLIPTSSELLAIKKNSCINTVDADLIDIELRATKARLLYVLEPFIDQEIVLRIVNESLDQELNDKTKSQSLLGYHTWAQYIRRIVLHEPVLSLKATNKVSFKDLLLDEEFTAEDVERIGVLLGIGLLWCKDSLIEAMSIIRNKLKGTAANVGDPSNHWLYCPRFKILGGWIFNTPHSGTMSNEMWGNRFARICNSYNDMISYLSFGALGLFPPPTFCARFDKGRNGLAPRNHLSLSGVVIADMVTGEPQVIPIPGPVPTLRRGRSPGSTIWVVLHSETDPGQKFECFGSGNEALPAFQMRTFEALPTFVNNHPLGVGEWQVQRSAADLLFAMKGMLGYLTSLTRPDSSGWVWRG